MVKPISLTSEKIQTLVFCDEPVIMACGSQNFGKEQHFPPLPSAMDSAVTADCAGSSGIPRFVCVVPCLAGDTTWWSFS